MAEGTNVGSIFIDLVVRDTVDKQVQRIAERSQATTQKAFSGMERAMEESTNKTISKSQKLVGGLTKVCDMLANGPARAMEKALKGSLGNTIEKTCISFMKMADTIANGPARAMEKALSGTSKQVEETLETVELSAEACETQIEEALTKPFDKSVALAEVRATEIERQLARITDALANAVESKDTAASEKLYQQQIKAMDRLKVAKERLAVHAQAAALKQAAAEETAQQKIAASAEKTAAQKKAADQKAVVDAQIALQKTVAAEEKAANRRKSIHVSMWKNMLSKIGAGIKSVFTKVDKSTSRFGTRLKGIVSSALVFNILSAGLRNVTNYIGKTISATDEMKSALANLKGAAANAASPIIQVLTPALAALANAAATVFTYVSKLMTALTGKVSNAAAMASKSASNASGAAKKATKSLAGFDEINTLSGGSDSSGGASDSESEKANYNFEGQSPFLDSVLAAINAGQWGQVGTLFAQKINDSLAKIDWATAGTAVSDCAKGLLTTLCTFLEETDWQQIGNGIEEFLGSIDWSGIVSGIAEGFGAAVGGLWAALWAIIEEEWNSMMETWMENTELCGGDVVAGLLLGILNAICDIGKWIVDNIFTPFIEGFKKAFGIHSPSTVMEEQGDFIIAGLLNGIIASFGAIKQWIADNVLTPFVTAFTKAWTGIQGIWGGAKAWFSSIVSAVSTYFVNLWKSVTDWTSSALNKVKAIWGGIKAWFQNITTGTSTYFVNLWKSVMAWTASALAKVKEIWGTVTAWFTSKVYTPVASVFTKVKTAIGNAFTGAVNGLKTAWGKISTWFSTNVSSPIQKVFSTLSTRMKSILNGIIGFLNKLVSGVTSGINSVIKAINKIKVTIPSWIPSYGGKSIGFNLSTLTAPQIPYLAQGAVLPANKPFLAMVGDQKHGTNVEAPLSTIQEAVAVVMEDMIQSNMAGHEATVAVLREILEAILGIQIGDDVIANAVTSYQRKMAIARGG